MNQNTDTLQLLLKANALRSNNQYKEAIELYRRIIPIAGKTFHVCRVIGYCYHALAENSEEDPAPFYHEAAQWLSEALNIIPDNGRVRAQLAELYATGLCSYTTAATEYRRAIVTSPSDSWILTSAASLYGIPEEVVTRDEAILWLERAGELEPNDPNIWARLGELYYKAGRQGDALLVWIKAATCTLPLSKGYHDRINELS
jgi:tetratricopeptide (TPR) repeat protein